MSQSRRWCFTINNPLPSDFPTLENVQHSRFIIYQRERGAQETEHIQGYVEFNRPIRLAAIKRSIPRAHLEVARGNHTANVQYCSKEPRIGTTVILGEPPAPGKRNDIAGLIEGIRRGSSDTELFNEFPSAAARYPRLRQAINLADKSRPPQPLQQLRSWQSEIMILFDSPPHPRKINWIWEETGGIGKTAFARHLAATRDVFYCTGGKHADILFAYNLQDTIIFDLPRSYKDKIPYGVLEAFKNGCIFSTKYESRTLFFDVPHVFVFANFQPVRTELSADRWNVINVIENGLAYLMTI